MIKSAPKVLWGTAFVALLFGLYFVFYGGTELISRALPSSSDQVSAKPTPVSTSTRLLIGGDIMWGRSLEVASLKTATAYSYPFSGLETLGKNQYQAWIANLECPSTDTAVPFSEQSTLLRFNCNPDFLPEFAKWFDVVSLSNNHTDNVDGVAGLKQTRQKLDEHGIQYFGHYDNSVKSEICEVITVSAYNTLDNFNVEPAVLPIALCGYHGVFRIPTDSELSVIKQYSKWLPVVVMPHMGAEYEPVNDQLRQRAYRQMIDNGADVVAGGHPHWIQNTEVYKGKLIMYSLGNLIFDQNFSDEVRRSAMLDLKLTVPYSTNSQKWSDIAAKCSVFGDSCLDLAQQQGLSKLQAQFEFEVVGTTMKDMIASRASAAQQEAILKRLNWSDTVKILSTQP